MQRRFEVIKSRYLAPVAALLLASATACQRDFLTGGDLSTDPNRPTTAQAVQLFAGVETNIWAFLGSDPARVTGMWSRQFAGGQNQYQSIYNYQYDEGIASGYNAGLYAAGGLVDIVRAQKIAQSSQNFVLLGILQVQEGLLMGTGADMFGNLVYSEALSSTANPKLDDQLAVYDSVQKVLSAAITNMATASATNASPGGADLVYGGSTAKWTALAHTLKARFYMHTAEARPAAYAQALTESISGISSNAGNYVGAFTSSSNEQNFYFQFGPGPSGRSGYLIPDPQFVSLLQSRSDPRLAEYFQPDFSDLSDERLDPAFQQPFVTFDENLLIWAEAGYRIGNQTVGLKFLNQERANHGLAPVSLSGQALLNEILIEKYISDFQLGHEAWNDFKRTCTPNFAPTQPGKLVPSRFYYDTNERLTNTNIPAAGQGFNGTRNPDDPINTVSDGTGAACLAG
jgi:starch-binding outer membrane protein, SusD/RagB family